MDARIVYLIAFPATAVVKGQAQPPPFTKAAPYFLELDTTLAELGQGDIAIDGVRIAVRRQLIDNQVQSVECVYALPDVLNPNSNRQRQKLQAKLRQWVLDEARYGGSFVEEYTAVCLDTASPDPDAFVAAHRLALAPLLRSEARTFTDSEAALIMESRAHYSDRDLTIVEWKGALIIDLDREFQSEIELLKIGNYQILRYRLLDRAIERNLAAIRRELETKRHFRVTSKVLSGVLEQRLSLLLDFEKSEQTLLLIGDWYTAQLYRLIVDEFYIDEWKAAVHAKLDQLESITDTVRENFSLSWQRFFDFVQLVGWLLLLIGYFVLFYLDLVKLNR